jgi:hypothetical protein
MLGRGNRIGRESRENRFRNFLYGLKRMKSFLILPLGWAGRHFNLGWNSSEALFKISMLIFRNMEFWVWGLGLKGLEYNVMLTKSSPPSRMAKPTGSSPWVGIRVLREIPFTPNQQCSFF